MCALRSSSWTCWTHQAWYSFLFLCLFWWDGNGNGNDELHGANIKGSSIVSRSNQKLGTTTFEMDSTMS